MFVTRPPLRDFRRTAVRNMVHAGVPERVAMKVTGHKARAVLYRYHFVSPNDLQDVARRLTGTFVARRRLLHSGASPKFAILQTRADSSAGRARPLQG